MPVLWGLLGIIFYIYCEISLLVEVGSALGVLPTLLLLIVISFVGLWFVKLRGAYTLMAVRQQLAKGELPTDAVINAMLFILAGILLIIPGFLSDILAVLMVLPITRTLFKLWFFKFFKSRVRFTHFTQFRSGQGSESEVFEAEFTREQDKNKWIK